MHAKQGCGPNIDDVWLYETEQQYSPQANFAYSECFKGLMDICSALDFKCENFNITSKLLLDTFMQSPDVRTSTLDFITERLSSQNLSYVNVTKFVSCTNNTITSWSEHFYLSDTASLFSLHVKPLFMTTYQNLESCTFQTFNGTAMIYPKCSFLYPKRNTLEETLNKAV